jgi:4-amino-4-deoxy-L-arabinose transferase-like glycosyltransferase
MPGPAALAGGPVGVPLTAVLAGGALLRVLVFWFLAPANNDPHLEFVQFLVERGRLPFSDELTLGFQPPLYYLLAAPFWWLTGSAKAVQLLSLVLSLVNLGLLFRFVVATPLISTERGRLHAALLAALLPQFVLFGSFVSNDALAFPLGTWLFLAILSWLERPTRGRLLALGALQGAGLLTKGTFIAYLPIAAAAILVVALRRRWPVARLARALVAFGLVTVLVGGYKFAENAWRFGTPVVSNDELEQAWVQHQQPTYVGPSSLLDVDVTKLVREPWVSDASRQSIPLLMYGTFWYGMIRESNFTHTREEPWAAVPRAIYALAVVPTLLMVLGAALALWRARSLLRPLHAGNALRAGETTFELRAGELVALLALAGQLTLVLTWGFKHDAWSFFQSRLCFAAFLSFALLLAWGLDALERRPGLARGASAVLWLLNVAFLAYYALEMTGELMEV